MPDQPAPAIVPPPEAPKDASTPILDLPAVPATSPAAAADAKDDKPAVEGVAKVAEGEKKEGDGVQADGDVKVVGLEEVKAPVEPPKPPQPIPQMRRRPAPVTNYPYTDDVDCRYLRRLPIPLQEHPHIDWRTALNGVYGVSPLTLLERETGAAILIRKNGSGYPVNKPTNVSQRSPLELMKIRAGAAPPGWIPGPTPSPKPMPMPMPTGKPSPLAPDLLKFAELEKSPSPSPGISNVALPPSAPGSHLGGEGTPAGIEKAHVSRHGHNPPLKVEENQPKPVEPVEGEKKEDVVVVEDKKEVIPVEAVVVVPTTPDQAVKDEEPKEASSPKEPAAAPAPDSPSPAVPLEVKVEEPASVPLPLPSGIPPPNPPKADGIVIDAEPFIGPVKPSPIPDWPSFRLPMPSQPPGRAERIAIAQRNLQDLILRHKEERLKLINEDLGSRMFDTHVQDDLEEELILMMERQQVERNKARQAIDAIIDDGLHFLVLAEHEIDADACLDKLQWLIDKIIDEHEDAWVSDDETISDDDDSEKDFIKFERKLDELKAMSPIGKEKESPGGGMEAKVVPADAEPETNKNASPDEVKIIPEVKVIDAEVVDKAQDLKGIKDGKEGNTEQHVITGVVAAS